MLGTSIASFSFILASSIFGMPISGTHTVIGALIGAGLAGLKASTLNWTKVEWTVASWFISPVLAAILAGLLFLVVCTTTLGGSIHNPKARLFNLTVISGLSLAFADYMVLGLVVENVQPADYYSILGAFFVGLFGCRLCLILKAVQLSTQAKGWFSILIQTFCFWSFEPILNLQPKDDIVSQKTAIAHYSYSSAGSDSLNLTDKDKSECYILDLEKEAYRFLLVISACLVCLAHGSNDVANSIAPLLVELSITT
jgi:phosphate/sulfate permease